MPPTDTTSYGLYQINTSTPEKASKAELEITAFHEDYPGHHMQMAIASASELTPPHKIIDIYQNSEFRIQNSELSICRRLGQICRTVG
jgi:uncharacterized protein (DUF885 family)